MKFIKLKYNSKVIVEPLEKYSLFKHCTGGATCMEFKTFVEETLPILHAHGINMITYEEGE